MQIFWELKDTEIHLEASYFGFWIKLFLGRGTELGAVSAIPSSTLTQRNEGMFVFRHHLMTHVQGMEGTRHQRSEERL